MFGKLDGGVGRRADGEYRVMKRVSFFFLLCAVAGAMLNVVVAWGCVYFLDPVMPYDEDGSLRLGIGGNYPPVTIDGVKKIVQETGDEIKKRDGDRVAIEKLWIQLKRYGNIFMENFSSSAGTLAAGAITSVAVIAAASGFAQIFDRVAGLIRMFLDALQI